MSRETMMKIMYKWILDHGYEPVIIATKLDKIKRSQITETAELIRQGLQVVPEQRLFRFLPRPNRDGKNLGTDRRTDRNGRAGEDSGGINSLHREACC